MAIEGHGDLLFAIKGHKNLLKTVKEHECLLLATEGPEWYIFAVEGHEELLFTIEGPEGLLLSLGGPEGLLLAGRGKAKRFLKIFFRNQMSCELVVVIKYFSKDYSPPNVENTVGLTKAYLYWIWSFLDIS